MGTHRMHGYNTGEHRDTLRRESKRAVPRTSPNSSPIVRHIESRHIPLPAERSPATNRDTLPLKEWHTIAQTNAAPDWLTMDDTPCLKDVILSLSPLDVASLEPQPNGFKYRSIVHAHPESTLIVATGDDMRAVMGVCHTMRACNAREGNQGNFRLFNH